MAIVLGLIAAIAYGTADFSAGMITKRSGIWPVVAVVQATALVCTLGALPFMPGHLSGSTVGWGVLAGSGPRRARCSCTAGWPSVG